MTTSVYVAGASSEADDCSHWIARVRDAGFDVTLDWPAAIRAVGAANPRDAAHDDRLRWSAECLHGAITADVLWLLVPETVTIGAWVELGAALVHPTTHRQRRIVSGDWRKSIFTAQACERFSTHAEAYEWLLRQREAA